MGAAENTRVLLSDKDTDIIDVVQDAPISKRIFKLSGWAASASSIRNCMGFRKKVYGKERFNGC